MLTPAHGRRTRRLGALALLSLIAVGSSGCVARKMATLYPPPERPLDQIAVVSGEDDGNGAVFIEVADGTKLNDHPWEWFIPPFSPARVNDLQLLPGVHTLEVSWIVGKGGRSTSNAVLKFNAEAGHRYIVWAGEIPPGGAWKSIGLFIGGGRSTWTAWITDAQSGAVVAGAPPPQ